MRIVSAAGREAEFEIAGAGVANQPSELSIDGRMSLRFSDVSLLFLNIVFVSLVCLRRECRNCKTIALFNLILSDWLAVVCGTFSEQPLQTYSFPPLLNVLQEPTVLLHTGLLFLGNAVLLVNLDLSHGIDDKRYSYIHLVVFNGLSLSAVSALRDGLARLLLKSGYQADKATDMMGTMFITSTYRMIFLMIDSVYYLYLNGWKKPEKRNGFTIAVSQKA